MSRLPVPSLSPFVLARVAGLPLEPLIDTSPPKTTANIDAAVAARLQADAMRPELDRALHAAVPSLGPHSRLATIELKRAVHNSRLCEISNEVLRDIVSALPPRAGATLKRWMNAQRIAVERLRDAEASHHEEVLAHVRPALRGLVEQEAFRRPLVMASRSMFEGLLRETGYSPTRCSATKTERSLLSYLARASAKTSPFSTFMHVAVFKTEGGTLKWPQLDPGDRGSHTSLNRGVVFNIRSHAFGCCGDRRHASLVMSPTITWAQGDTVEVMAPRFGVVERRILRLCYCARFRVPHELALVVSRLPIRLSWAKLMESLVSAGLLPVAAEHFADRLCNHGVIQVAPWTDGFHPHPESSGRHRLDTCSSPAAEDLRSALDAMGRDAIALNTADSQQRAELLAKIDAEVARASRVVGAEIGPAAGTPVLEDGFFRRPAGPIGTVVRGILEEVATVLQPCIELSPSYAALRELYLDLYGCEGICCDLVDFLCQAAESLGRADLRLPPEGGGTLSPSGDRPAVPATVFLQLLGDAASAAVAVINRVHPGCGWLSARHAVGDDPVHESLRESLRDWLIALAAPAEPIDILLSGDCNPIQSHPRLTDRVLVTPLEPCLCDGALTLRDVKLRFNTRSGQIEMNAGKTTVAPMYLGTTYPNLAWGPMYWLTVLAVPWCLRPLDRSSVRVEVAPGVAYSPRRVIGRIVVERASWLIAREHLRQVWFCREGMMRTADVAMDCAKLGIPRLFFVRPSQFSSQGRNGTHKPMWVDSRNPFMLDLLRSRLTEAEQVSITEALPDRPTWPTLHGLRHVAELHVELAL